MGAALATARGTDLEPTRLPIRMWIRIKFHALHKGDQMSCSAKKTDRAFALTLQEL
jgi:hypothetical protein